MSLDRFRNRKTKGDDGLPYDTEILIKSFSRKAGAEEARVILATMGNDSHVLINIMKNEGSDWIKSRGITFGSEYIEPILDGIDQALTQYRVLVGTNEDALPSFPIVCGNVDDLTIKLGRFNGYYNINLNKKCDDSWANLRPGEVEGFIEALVEVSDRINGASGNRGDQGEIPF